MSKHASPSTGRGNRRTVAAAAFGIGVLALTGAGVYAGLNANATGSQAVSSGTLKLTVANNGAGFSQAVANLAPGDVVNRFVDVTSGGTLDAQSLTLGAADSSPTKLTTDGTNGLHVTVSACTDSVTTTGATWTTGGVCQGSLVGGLPGQTSPGTTTVVANNASLTSLISSPATLFASVPAGAVEHLKMAVTLPDQNETTTNGTLPANSIQGLTANLTWTFNEAQRTATTTSS